MNLKTKIKNDLWKINYIIPFTAKYLQFGKKSYFRMAIPFILKTKVVNSLESDISTDTRVLMEEIDLHASVSSSFFYYIDENKTIAVKGQVISNFTLDYERLIKGAFDEYANKAIAVGGIYAQRATNINEAVHILRNRIYKTISEEYPDGTNKDRLLEEFSSILEEPVKHFHEGLQRILFFNQFLWQTRHRLNGLGRLDKILGHLYEKDMAEGIITEDVAYEMIREFLQMLHKYYCYKSSALLGDIGQIIVLGGLREDGSYFYNDLTSIFMKAQADIRQPDPKILLRVSKEMPDYILREAIVALQTKTGSPLFSNDDIIISKLVKFGMPSEDAYNYCVSACWEPYIPGKSLDQNNVCTVDFFKPLDVCLNRMLDKNISSFEVLFEEYEKDLKKTWAECCKNLDSLIWSADPFVSIVTDGCTELGKDISEGGAIYSNYGVTSIGMGSVVDTLLNIKKLVFDEGKYTIEELNKYREKNFRNAENVYILFQNMEKHYAHDEIEAITLTNRIIEVSNNAVMNYINPLGGRLKFGMSSPDYIKGAKKVPADLAGRKKGTPYGVHISSPHAAYTEIVNFAGKINYDGCAFNGNVVDFFLPPSLLEQNLNKFVIFMKVAIKSGFFQMQMNLMDSNTLIDAKVHPEKYPGLIVRVWGFSAYFNDLPESYKDVLIQRTIESEKIW